MTSREGRSLSDKKNDAYWKASSDRQEDLDRGPEVQGRSACDADKSGVDLDPILEQLGRRGRYQVTQLSLCIAVSFLFSIPLMDVKFLGYQPDYRCNDVDNVSQLAAYLPDDVTNFTHYDVEYHQCSIDVTVNTSGTSSIHSLPCVAGVNFSSHVLTSFLTEWSLVCEKAGRTELTLTGLYGGNVVGSFLFSLLADLWVRRRVCVGCLLGTLVCLVSSVCVSDYGLYLACRTVLGCFTVGMVHPAYTMFMELMPQDRRSVTSVMDNVFYSLACVFMAVVAFSLQGLSWRYLGLALYSPYVLGLFIPCFLDESLRWLLATGRTEEAERLLQKACRMNHKDFQQIKPLLRRRTVTDNDLVGKDHVHPGPRHDREATDTIHGTDGNKKKGDRNDRTLNDGAGNVEEVDVSSPGVHPADQRRSDAGDDCKERSVETAVEPRSRTVPAKYTVLDLFRHRVLFVPFLVTIFVWVVNNLYFYAVILGSINLSGNRFLNFALLNLQNFPSNLVALFLVLRVNRRPQAFVYGLLSGCFLLISVGLVELGGGEGVTLTLATVAQYAGMFFQNGTYILLFIYFLEVYPTSIRAVGSGAATTVMTSLNMAVPFVLLWMQKTPWALGILVGCLLILASLSVWLLPETRHRKLPDTIEEIKAWRRKSSVMSV